ARTRRARRRGRGPDHVRRQEAAERCAHPRRGVAAAGSVHADRRRLRFPRGPRHTTPQVVAEKTYLQAISDGLRQEMRQDKRVFVIGEDVGVYGGAFKVTLGFQEEFGPWRVIDAPLSETAIVGGCTGAAILGMPLVGGAPFGQARVHREGDDITLVTWGAMVWTADEAAQELEGDGVSVEILDLRTLIPWDKKAVLESARKTSKVIVLHEDTHTGGFGGEIAATIAEEAFEDLDAPVKRIAAPDTPVPFSPPLEKAYIPQVDDVVAGLRELAEY